MDYIISDSQQSISTKLSSGIILKKLIQSSCEAEKQFSSYVLILHWCCLNKAPRSFCFKVKDLRVSKLDRYFWVKKTRFVSRLSLPIINTMCQGKSINLSKICIFHLWNGIILWLEPIYRLKEQTYILVIIHTRFPVIEKLKDASETEDELLE